MIANVQILLKIFFVIGMVLFSNNASASYFLECIGFVTIKSDLAEFTKCSEVKKKHIKADIYIHEHTFTCKGHESAINIKGKRKKSMIDLTESINERILKKGSHLQVKYSYSDSVMSPPFIEWVAIRIMEIIPPEKTPPKRVKTNPAAESPTGGVDIFIEESIWGKYQKELPSYKDFERTTFGGKDISVTNEFFSIYRGKLFKIIHPKSFSIKPLKPVEQFDINFYRNEHLEIEPKLPPKYFEYVDTDETYFTSPDSLVEFFVYAKDSSDNPSSYLKVTEDKVKLSSNSDKFSYEKEHLNHVLKAWVTIKAKDNSYYRSYSHQRACHVGEKDWNDCETQVFGIKYSSTEAYNKIPLFLYCV